MTTGLAEQDVLINPAIVKLMKRANPPCYTNGTTTDWCSSHRGKSSEVLLGQAKAVHACRRDCHIRLVCAGWGFEIEDNCIFGGFKAKMRERLKVRCPELVAELISLAQCLVRLRILGFDRPPLSMLYAPPFSKDDVVERAFLVIAEIDEVARQIEVESAQANDVPVYDGADDDGDGD